MKEDLLHATHENGRAGNKDLGREWGDRDEINQEMARRGVA